MVVPTDEGALYSWQSRIDLDRWGAVMLANDACLGRAQSSVMERR